MSLALPIIDTAVQRPVYARGPQNLDAVRLLRLSLTDRCNLRCIYCMPTDGVAFFEHKDLLSADDFLAVAAAAREQGIDHFKLTGGEPTVRGDLIEIVERLAGLDPADLSMTTNGLLLAKLAPALRQAGLNRLTISLDSLRPDRFKKISGDRPYELADVWRGIDAATEAGFEWLKINVVVIAGINDDEVADFARLTLDRPWTVRFIEYMPVGDSALLASGLDEAAHRTLDTAELIQRIEQDVGPLQPVNRTFEKGVGPAHVYELPQAAGRVGFISAMSQPFCESCNRLRLTARGELRACLFDGCEVDLLPILRQGKTPNAQAIADAMARCVSDKPDTHSKRGNRAMSQLGG